MRKRKVDLMLGSESFVVISVLSNWWLTNTTGVMSPGSGTQQKRPLVGFSGKQIQTRIPIR